MITHISQLLTQWYEKVEIFSKLNAMVHFQQPQQATTNSIQQKGGLKLKN